MITLDWTLGAAAVVFLFTLWALNRLLFQPLLATIAERRARTVGLEGDAAQTLRRHELLFDDYSAKIKEQKQAGYQLADAARQEALSGRQQVLSGARERADKLLAEARSQLERDVAAAEKGLRTEVEELAGLIAARALRQSEAGR